MPFSDSYLDELKDKYRHAFYDHKRDRIVLVAAKFNIHGKKGYYLDCAHSGMFGHTLKLDKCNHWIGLGEL